MLSKYDSKNPPDARQQWPVQAPLKGGTALRRGFNLYFFGLYRFLPWYQFGSAHWYRFPAELRAGHRFKVEREHLVPPTASGQMSQFGNNPPFAFLCGVSIFNSSHGSWWQAYVTWVRSVAGRTPNRYPLDGNACSSQSEQCQEGLCSRRRRR